MKIFINNHPYELPEGATVTDAVAAIQAGRPSLSLSTPALCPTRATQHTLCSRATA